MESELKPGPELDKAVCEACGIPPKLHWLVSLPWMSRKESSHPSREAAEARLKELQWLEKKWGEGEIDEVREYPPVSTDPGAALTLVVGAVRNWHFSERQRFCAALREELVQEVAYPEGIQRLEVAWPDVLFYLQPEHLCRAALAVIATNDIQTPEGA